MSLKKRILVYALVVLLFAGLAAFYVRPMAARPGEFVLGHTGEAIFNIYILAWSSHALRTNPLNLYNTTMFFPNSNTLAYTDNEFMSTLLSLPAAGLTRNPVAAYNWVVFLSFVLSALGAFLLVDHLCGDKLAALAGGVVFGFPLLKIHHIAHLQVISTAALPLALLCLHLYTEKRKPVYAFLFAAFAVAAFWTAWSYGFFLAYAVLLYLVVLLVLKRKTALALLRGDAGAEARKSALRWAGFLIAAAAVIVLVLTPFILPYLKIQRSDPGFYRNIKEVEFYSPDVKNFVVAPPESLVWGAATGGLRNDSPEQTGFAEQGAFFAGLLPVLLACAGIVYLVKRRKGHPRERFTLWYYSALIVTALVLCLGVTLFVFGRRIGLPMPYRLLYSLFPGFKSIRTPGRMFVLVILALSVLAGFGVRLVLETMRGRGHAFAGSVAVVVLVAALAFEMMPARIHGKELLRREEFPPGLRLARHAGWRRINGDASPAGVGRARQRRQAGVLPARAATPLLQHGQLEAHGQRLLRLPAVHVLRRRLRDARFSVRRVGGVPAQPRRQVRGGGWNPLQPYNKVLHPEQAEEGPRFQAR